MNPLVELILRDCLAFYKSQSEKLAAMPEHEQYAAMLAHEKFPQVWRAMLRK